jgi:hypothetical protein
MDKLRVVTVISLVPVLLALWPASHVQRHGLTFGYTSARSVVMEAGEGEEGSTLSLDFLPTRSMVVWCWEGSMYPNDLVDVPTTYTDKSHWFASALRPSEGFAPEACPTTYPTRFGFAYMNESVHLSSHSSFHYIALIAPGWFPLLLVLLPPAASSLLLVRRGQRIDAGLCPSCAYDLRASPDRCPECGEVNDSIHNTASASPVSIPDGQASERD